MGGRPTSDAWQGRPYFDEFHTPHRCTSHAPPAGLVPCVTTPLVLAYLTLDQCTLYTWQSPHVAQYCAAVHILIAPVVLCAPQDEQGIVTHYVGIQTDVSAAAEAGLLDTPEKMTEQQAAGKAGKV